jgi:hypothetical protein
VGDYSEEWGEAPAERGSCPRDADAAGVLGCTHDRAGTPGLCREHHLLEVNVVESKLRYGVWYLLAHSKLVQLGILAASGGEVSKVYSDTFDEFYGVPDIHLTPEEVGYRSNFHMVQ